MTFVKTDSMRTLLNQALHGTQAFSLLGDEALRQLSAHASPLQVEEGKHLFHAGDRAEAFFWLQSGRLRLYRLTHDAEEKVFQLVTDGDLVAETAMFAEPNCYPLSAQAETRCVLYRLPRANLLSLVRHSPELAMRLLASMSTRLYQAVNRIDQLTISNSSQRLVLYLLDLHQQQRSRWVTLPVQVQVLARQLNISPETLSRLLSQFKQAELISGKRREWVLLNPDGLCRAVNLPLSVLENYGGVGGSQFICCNFR